MDSSLPVNHYTGITSNLIVLDLPSVDIWGNNWFSSIVPYIQLQVRNILSCLSAKVSQSIMLLFYKEKRQ